MPRLHLSLLADHPARKPGLSDEAATLTIDVQRGVTVLDAAISKGIAIATLCGGAMHCKMCRVNVAAPEAAASPCGQREREVLAGVGAEDGERLACQVKVLADDVRVWVPSPLERLR